MLTVVKLFGKVINNLYELPILYIKRNNTSFLAVENEADKLVTPQELFGIAKVIEGSWVEFALDLAPDMFQVRGNISSIQKDPNYASARVMAKAMLEIWTDEMHSEGTRRVLIQALCRNGMRKQACDVFGDEVTAIVAPQ
jgi:hypothetical protein